MLNYWRKDLLFNEHHEHWHLVYKYAGQIHPSATKKELLEAREAKNSDKLPKKWKDRHGELFYYMHSQMLARYNTERYCNGLDEVKPYKDFSLPIETEYNAKDEYIEEDGKRINVASRSKNKQLKGITQGKFSTRPGSTPESLQMHQRRIELDLSSTSSLLVQLDLSKVSELIEPTNRLFTEYYGAVHNDGHILSAMPEGDDKKCGPMFWEETAVRDPFFYMWHANIDRLFQHKITQLNNPNMEDLPKVSIDEPMLVSARGGKNDKLYTEHRKTVINGKEVTYLTHESFEYVFSVKNESDQDQQVIFRMFACLEKKISDRRWWIELDKFAKTIKADAPANYILRSDTESSVIRHPVITNEMLEQAEQWPSSGAGSAGCECGWPYNLLLPIGSKSGIKFRLFIIATKGSDFDDNAQFIGTSTSYCGLKNDEYPDSKPMGFPFNAGDNEFTRKIVNNDANLAQVTTLKFEVQHEIK